MQSNLMSCEVNEKEEGAGQSHASWCPVPHVHIQIPIVLKAISPAREMETGPADSLLLSPRTFEIGPSRGSALQLFLRMLTLHPVLF